MLAEHPEYRAPLAGAVIVVAIVLAVAATLVWGQHHNPTAKPNPAATVGAATPAPTTADPLSDSQAAAIAGDFATIYFAGGNPSKYLTPQERGIKALQGGPQRATVTNVKPAVEGQDPDGSISVMVSAQVNGQPQFVEVWVDQAGLIEQVSG